MNLYRMAVICNTCGLPEDLCACDDLAKDSTQIIIRLETRRFRKKGTMIEPIPWRCRRPSKRRSGQGNRIWKSSAPSRASIVRTWAIEAPRAHASEAQRADARARRLREQENPGLSPSALALRSGACRVAA